MPRMGADANSTMESQKIGKGVQAFQFSGVRVENLGATEYTLVTIAVDTTGSVAGFVDDLKRALTTAIESCQKSPRSMNLLLRVILFNSSLPKGIEEIHGFKPLSEIDVNSYPDLVPGGLTPLHDAMFSAVGATNAYAKKLMEQEFSVNGIVFVITDGGDNTSGSTPNMIRAEMERGLTGEEIESLVGVLIGINVASYANVLAKLAAETKMSFIDVGAATKGKLAKLAQFVSQSVSSQSQALGTGGPSQNIAATI